MQMYCFSQLGHFQINNSPLSIFFCSSGFKVTLMEEYKVILPSVPQFGQITSLLIRLVILLFVFYCYVNNPIAYSFVTHKYFSISPFPFIVFL